jgi:hypothetical protein
MRNLKQFPLAILTFPIAAVSSLELQKPIGQAQTAIAQPLLGFGTWNLNISPKISGSAISPRLN